MIHLRNIFLSPPLTYRIFPFSFPLPALISHLPRFIAFDTTQSIHIPTAPTTRLLGTPAFLGYRTSNSRFPGIPILLDHHYFYSFYRFYDTRLITTPTSSIASRITAPGIPASLAPTSHFGFPRIPAFLTPHHPGTSPSWDTHLLEILSMTSRFPDTSLPNTSPSSDLILDRTWDLTSWKSPFLTPFSWQTSFARYLLFSHTYFLRKPTIQTSTI
ncbi:LAFE_0F00100g1_1 [Lachancea fermentati]|uniref:LAFE_0F00100g1_1 n=1 Tax=Lachancea fermentati TaxID=4955 RepID=A0A1G4ME77_LACFM|nr:LAFE_0F00100g1_1 [Lachancea fermentati]